MVIFSISGAVMASESGFSASPFFGEVNYQYELDSRHIDSRYGTPTSRLSYEKMKMHGISLGYKNFDSNGFYDYELRIGTGNGNGSFLDKDWYSDKYASEQGREPLFSSTVSQAELELYLSLTFNTGLVYRDILGIDRATVGFMNKIGYQSYTSYGLVPLIDSYGFQDTGNPVYGASEEMVAIKTVSYSVGVDLGAKEYLYKDLYLSGNLAISPYSMLYTYDYHYKRSDIDGYFNVISYNYGADASISLGYEVGNFDISASMKKSWLNSYSPANEKYQEQSRDESVFMVGIERKI